MHLMHHHQLTPCQPGFLVPKQQTDPGTKKAPPDWSWYGLDWFLKAVQSGTDSEQSAESHSHPMTIMALL